jgi:hypothetical protein
MKTGNGFTTLIMAFNGMIDRVVAIWAKKRRFTMPPRPFSVMDHRSAFRF